MGGIRSCRISQLARLESYMAEFTVGSSYGHTSGKARTTCLPLPKIPIASGSFFLTEGSLGTDALAHNWPWGMRKYKGMPAHPVTVQGQGGWGAVLVSFSSLAQPDLDIRTLPPRDSPCQDLLSQGQGTIWHPHPDLWKLPMWSIDRARKT